MHWRLPFGISSNIPPLSSEDILQSLKGGTSNVNGEFVHQNDGHDKLSTEPVELPENLSVLLWTMTVYCASCFHVPWRKRHRHGISKKLPTGKRH
jgi:hypothetical protein